MCKKIRKLKEILFDPQSWYFTNKFSSKDKFKWKFLTDDQQKMLQLIKMSLKILTKKQRNVIKMLFLNKKVYTQNDVAKKIGISRSTVRTILKAAIKKLKKELNDKI